ncbi:hypothetical protein [Achromobacter deleyi]|uniref:hypothetical protein n=1 Tax=Achromobacter deleyi TaxID=1353891 RepID=UPI0014924D3E|nr:hypothetical protein [Achromobacter deleyi]QVQ26802.1 hypothetical protein HLG70_28980 [Achromobacter deleyi]UIP22375.1 hypothetical protein LYZ39_07655 [Achromobacter deleyi]
MSQNSAAHDLGTSSGGRAYIAGYFATQLGRHDFTRYINDRLAADFACVLARHLSKLRAEGVQAGATVETVTDALAAFEAWNARTKQGYDLTRAYSGKLSTYESDLTEHAWRGYCHAALASTPVAKPKRAPLDDWRVQAIADCLEAEWDEISPDLAEANARIIVDYLYRIRKGIRPDRSQARRRTRSSYRAGGS